MKNSLKVNSVVRAFNLLEFFSGPEAEYSLTELSQSLSLSMGSTQRITSTLVELNYLKRHPKSKAFTLGPKCLSLGVAFLKHSELRKICIPYLKDLQSKINETVNLAIIDNTEIIYIEREETSHVLTTNIQVGSRRPVYCTSIGKAILAFMPEDKVKNIIDNISFKKHAKKTITNKEALMAELSRIRELEYAENISELSDDLFAIAVPILNSDSVAIAGINIIIPQSRVVKSIVHNKYVPLMIKAGRDISKDLGYIKL